MIRKKSSFFTFCFSLIPGAGQMYMGFMKRGTSLMSVFFLLIFLASWLHLGPLVYVMPVIWFFAFFDTHNLRSMSDDEFNAMDDNFIMIPEFAKEKALMLQSKYRNILALALIIIGLSILWNNIYGIIYWIMPGVLRELIWRFGQYFPQMCIGVIIIIIGVYLIRGKKMDLDVAENIKLLEDKNG